jgi:hypothetical protein
MKHVYVRCIRYMVDGINRNFAGVRSCSQKCRLEDGCQAQVELTSKGARWAKRCRRNRKVIPKKVVPAPVIAAHSVPKLAHPAGTSDILSLQKFENFEHDFVRELRKLGMRAGSSFLFVINLVRDELQALRTRLGQLTTMAVHDDIFRDIKAHLATHPTAANARFFKESFAQEL